MCSLYSVRRPAEEVRAALGFLEKVEFPPRDPVTPGSPVGIVRCGPDQERHFALVRWGFVPSWAKEIKPGKPLINARSETAFEKPSFRHAIKRRRCLVPADGFYEWQGDTPGEKQAYFIHRPGHQIFAFAGIWEHWMGADGSELETMAILTTPANATLAPLYHRMPVVIQSEGYAVWLDGASEAGAIRALLKPAPEADLIAEPVSLKPKKTAGAKAPKPAGKPQSQLDLF